jgi:hypothetical protein
MRILKKQPVMAALCMLCSILPEVAGEEVPARILY